MKYDAVVIGAGHNGLVAAIRLARAGRRVLVLEQRDRPGGLCAWEEFHPGYRVPGLLHDQGGFPPALARKLGIAPGLQTVDPAPALVPVANGGSFVLHRDPGQAAAELGGDAEAYSRWRQFLGGIQGVVRRLLQEAPPRLRPRGAGDLWRLAREGLAVRSLGRKRMAELLRVVPMASADWLGDSFRSSALAEALAGTAVTGTSAGPRSPGSSWNLVALECLAGSWIEGGPARLIERLVAAAGDQGVELRTSALVRSIRVAQGRVVGVALESGEEIEAAVVAASCDPKQTLLELVHPRELGAETQRGFEVLRARGGAAKVHLALAGELEFAARPGERFAAALVGGGDLDQLERASDAIKYRQFSERPFLEVRIPSVQDPSLAPEGHHVVSILSSFAPYELEGGWTDAARDGLGEAVLGQLERHVPDLRERIVAMEVLTPVDLQRRYRTTGGHLHHGEHALDQMLFMRPTPETAHYRTPIRGLFLAGSGCHPGGGVTGLPGSLAADAILR